MEISIDDIEIGDRFRKDLGDIPALAESIEKHGLLHDIVIDSQHRLICGHRRLTAAKSLGRSTITAKVVAIEDMLGAERDENATHKQFLPTEAVAIAREIEARERKEAQQRKRDAGKVRGRGQQIGCAKLAQPIPDSKPKRRDPPSTAKAASAVGMSRPTYEKAKTVVEAAEADPDEFGPIAEEMDRTGSVDRAYKQTVRKQHGAVDHPTKDAERRWGRVFRDIMTAVASVKDLGGIAKLTESWSENGKESLLDDLELANWDLLKLQRELKGTMHAQRQSEHPRPVDGCDGIRLVH